MKFRSPARPSAETTVDLKFVTINVTGLGRIAPEAGEKPVAVDCPPTDRIVAIKLGKSALQYAKTYPIDTREKPETTHRLRVPAALGERILGAFARNTQARSIQQETERNCHTFAPEVSDNIVGLAAEDEDVGGDAATMAEEVVETGVDITFMTEEELNEIPQGTRLVFAEEIRYGRSVQIPSGATISPAWTQTVHSAVRVGPDAHVIGLKAPGSDCIEYSTITGTRETYAETERLGMDRIRVFMPREDFNAYWYGPNALPLAPDPALVSV